MAKVTGVSSVIRGLATFGEKGKKAASMVVQSLTYQVRAEAQDNAPKHDGELHQSIIPISENEGLRGKVEVGAPHGPFVEFGTGIYVDVPAELQAEAAKFKGSKSGSFADLLENIKKWCKDKGIDESFAFPIAMKIARYGIKPQPYLYPAFVKYRKELKPKLQIALDRLVRETNARR